MVKKYRPRGYEKHFWEGLMCFKTFERRVQLFALYILLHCWIVSNIGLYFFSGNCLKNVFWFCFQDVAWPT